MSSLVIGAAYAKALGMLLEFYVSSVSENLPADPKWGVQAEGSEDHIFKAVRCRGPQATRAHLRFD